MGFKEMSQPSVLSRCIFDAIDLDWIINYNMTYYYDIKDLSL